MYCTLNPVAVTINPNLLTTKEHNYSESIRQSVCNKIVTATKYISRKTYINIYYGDGNYTCYINICQGYFLLFNDAQSYIKNIFELRQDLSDFEDAVIT